MNEYQGRLVARQNTNIAIVVARFNEFITNNLLLGALAELDRHAIDKNTITIIWVPGSFEIPLIAKKLAVSQRYAAIICLGAIIRGETPHFDCVVSQTAAGIAQIALESNVPLIFGVLTTETMEQSIDRAGGKAGNKGSEAVRTALEMIDLCAILEEQHDLKNVK